jgi:hypothetical protein
MILRFAQGHGFCQYLDLATNQSVIILFVSWLKVHLESRMKVLVFDANSQGIAVGSGALRPQGRFTIEAWVCPATDAGKQVIFADGEFISPIALSSWLTFRVALLAHSPKPYPVLTKRELADDCNQSLSHSSPDRKSDLAMT